MNLADYMDAKGMTLTELAAHLGKSPGHVSDWLSKRRLPRPDALAEICERTGGLVTPADLRPDMAALFVARPATGKAA